MIKPLTEKYGKEAMARIAEEIVCIDSSTNPPTAMLKDETRKLCWQLLGPPPDYKAPGDVVASAMEMGEKLKGPAPVDKRPVKPNKGRKKKMPVEPPGKPTEPVYPKNMTPLMQAYKDAKEKHPGMILLFRMGDFYEIFNDDAETCSKALGLTLTSRAGWPMAGFPHHQLESYLQKLLKAGLRVAVCEAVDPVKAPTKREVTRVVTPGSFSSRTRLILANRSC